MRAPLLRGGEADQPRRRLRSPRTNSLCPLLASLAHQPAFIDLALLRCLGS